MTGDDTDMTEVERTEPYECPCCGEGMKTALGQCDRCFVHCPTDDGECRYAY